MSSTACWSWDARTMSVLLPDRERGWGHCGYAHDPCTTLKGVTEAAVLHLRSLLARLRLANREFRQARRKLDELRAALTQTEAGGAPPLSDAAILASRPGVGKTTLASLLTEASGPLSRRD